jgi:hypothetical protein
VSELHSNGVYCVHCRDPSGALVVLFVNTTDKPMYVESHCKVKVCVGRGGDGQVLENRSAEALEQNKMLLPTSGSSGTSGFRWVAKWKVFRSTCVLPGQSQRIGLVLVPGGMQSQFGSISFQIKMVPPPHDETKCFSTSTSTSTGTLHHWLLEFKGKPASSSGRSQTVGLFRPLPSSLTPSDLRKLKAASDLRNLAPRTSSEGNDPHLDMALHLSELQDTSTYNVHDAEMEMVLALSRSEHIDVENKDDDDDLKRVLAQSRLLAAFVESEKTAPDRSLEVEYKKFRSPIKEVQKFNQRSSEAQRMNMGEAGTIDLTLLSPAQPPRYAGDRNMPLVIEDEE